jgi:methionine-rich copper-binding protein CopC
MGRIFQGLALAAVASFALVTAAEAAAVRLSSSTPATNTTVSTFKSLRFTFSEPIILANSGAIMMMDNGPVVPLGKPTTAGGNPRQLVVPVTKDLAPGKYSAAWHAVGPDGNRVDGVIFFEIKK